MSNIKTVKTPQASGTDDDMRDGMFLNAQAQFFPAWWTYIGTPKEYAPTYKVVCSSPQEINLARRLKPENVNAQFVLIAPAAAGPIRSLTGR